MYADAEGEVRRLFGELGLDASEEVVAAAAAEAGTTANVDLRQKAVGVEKWRDELTRRELRAFQRVAGDLLEELGYDPGMDVGRRWRRGSRRKSARADKPAPQASEKAMPAGKPVVDGHRVRKAIDLLDELLVAFKDASPEHAAALLAPDGVFERVADGTRSSATGEAAREGLARTLADDLALRGSQRAAEVFLQASAAAGFVTFELADGSQTERMYIVRARGEFIEKLVVFELARRPASGSPSA
jgi:hypothetical protein